MKKKLLSLAFAVVVSFSATANTPIDGEKKTVDTSKSTVNWKGYKVTGEHSGTISLKEGSLEFDGKKLIGGSFVMDMTSINTTDIQGEYKDKLDGHLKSDDFFGTTAHPTASLVFKTAKSFNKDSYTVTGDLTIKGITKEVTLVVSIFENKATATLKVDRTKFDIKYGSSSFFDDLKDKAIYDEFDLVVELAF